MPAKKDLIYPVFLECCAFSPDSYWELIFEDLAYGKAPTGTYISRNFLCCSYKNKDFSYKIERKDPKILFDDIYSLLSKKLGLMSEKEVVSKRTLFSSKEKVIHESYQTWSNIKKKNVKDAIYEKYAIDMKKKHGLSVSETKKLLTYIYICMIFKSVTSKDIFFEDDKITHIDGLEFEDGKVILTRSLCSGGSYSAHQELENKEILDIPLLWEKYIKNTLRIKV